MSVTFVDHPSVLSALSPGNGGPFSHLQIGTLSILTKLAPRRGCGFQRFLPRLSLDFLYLAFFFHARFPPFPVVCFIDLFLWLLRVSVTYREARWAGHGLGTQTYLCHSRWCICRPVAQPLGKRSVRRPGAV